MKWTRLVNTSQRPIYIAIADAITLAIKRGELQEGDRLPPHRTLARELGIDLTTVTRAYTEARHRGLIDATVGRGTFIRTPSAASQAAGRPYMSIDMSMNLPPQSQDPSLGVLLREACSTMVGSSNPALLMAYPPGGGDLRDREAAAFWLQPACGRVDPDRILIAPGGQSALAAVATLLLDCGATVLTDPVTYPNFRTLAGHLGLHLVPVDSDAEGMIPEAVERACRSLDPRAIYVVPSIQNPTTATLSAERRQSLAQVAAQFGIHLIEDDAYGMLPSQVLPAVSSFVPGQGYYIGTLSKCLSPGLRTAFMVAPDVQQAQRLTTALRAMALCASPLITRIVTNWITDGKALALRDGIRQENAARQKIAGEILPSGSFHAQPEGPHLWLSLPERWDRREFVAYLRRMGIILVPSDAFFVNLDCRLAEHPNAVRICLGGVTSQSVLTAALQSIAEALRREPGQLIPEVV